MDSPDYDMNWKWGLFGCLQNCNTCWANIFCWQCIFGKIAGKVGFGKLRGYIWTIVLICICVFAVHCCNLLQQEFQKSKIVECLVIENGFNSMSQDGSGGGPIPIDWENVDDVNILRKWNNPKAKIVLYKLKTMCAGIVGKNSLMENYRDNDVDSYNVLTELAKKEMEYSVTKTIYWMYLVCVLSIMTLTFLLRRRVRIVRKKEGNNWNDCLSSFCCRCCTMCQMTNEFEEEENLQIWDPLHYPESEV